MNSHAIPFCWGIKRYTEVDLIGVGEPICYSINRLWISIAY
ncbi:hypothetical protein EUBHAL_00323 [Anaerobutyricum hallii DSM 3353]|uniref:Uncharacterized protein n=1 Tax=Anaerobutyricum hallii DSM 3353 TaxID=411469 RepID=C0ESF0_9FIRM|nr:hypothetical protein EUBHAL_00323 [Anaerobutyricum hallii DSM 3353]